MEAEMTKVATSLLSDEETQELSERLADVFRTAEIGDVLTEDLFLDGHPPFWRFQLEGRQTFAAWLQGYSPDGADITVVRAVPTVSGFVTEMVGEHLEDGVVMTDRKILLCEVRGGQISELTIFCSGDWDEELRSRHAAETTLVRP
jgi:hypothetical protein